VDGSTFVFFGGGEDIFNEQFVIFSTKHAALQLMPP